MAEPTLKDVIERLKTEGQLVRNTGTNSIKAAKDILVDISASLFDQTNILREMLDLNKLVYEEAEQRRRLGVANRSDILPSPAPAAASDSPAPAATPGLGFDSLLGNLSKLGLILGGLAVGIGATIGVVSGQLKAIQAFFPKTSAAIIKLFDDLRISIASLFTRFRSSISNLFTRTIKIFDDSLAFIRGIFAVDSDSRIAKILTSIKGYISSIIRPFIVAADVLKDIVKTVTPLSGVFSSIRSLFSTFGSSIAGVAGTVGKLFAPIAIIITVFDTIREGLKGYAEGGILGGLEGALRGFLNSLIGAPLDLLKNIISWATRKLGFENFSTILDSFSFGELFTNMAASLFDGIAKAFSVIGDLFSFGEDDFTALGMLGKLTDLVFAPVNMAINFVRGIFGFDDSEEPFKLQDWINEKVTEIFDWVKNLFSFLPSVEDIKATLLSYLPEWMKPDSVNQQRQEIAQEINQQRQMIAEGDERNWRGKKREAIIQELEEDLSSLPQYNKGSQGFVDFGMGTPAVLHGIEAIVPKNTPAGAFLSTNFDENFKPITQRIETVQSSAISNTSAPIIIASAPTIAPVNNNVRGNTNYSSQRITSVGNGPGSSGLGRFAN